MTNVNFRGVNATPARNYATDFEIRAAKHAVYNDLPAGCTYNPSRKQDPAFDAVVKSYGEAANGWRTITITMRGKDVSLEFKAAPETPEQPETPAEPAPEPETPAEQPTEQPTDKYSEATRAAIAEAEAAKAEAAEAATEQAKAKAAEVKAMQAAAEAAKQAEAATEAAEAARAKAAESGSLDDMAAAVEAAAEASRTAAEAEQAQAEAKKAAVNEAEAAKQAEAAKAKAEAEAAKAEAAKAAEEAEQPETPETPSEPEPTPETPEPQEQPTPEPTPAGEGEIEHPRLRDIVEDLKLGIIPYLYGPAGTGKNTCAEQAARALGVPFYTSGTLAMKYELEGYKDAQGVFQESDFYKAVTGGGLFFLDECDATATEVLKAFNAILANGYYSFPNGLKHKHPKCYLIAGGNTTGRGNNSAYNAGTQLDASTLDRFGFEEFKYLKSIDMAAARGNKELVEAYQQLRKAVTTAQLDNYTVTPRAIKRHAALLTTKRTPRDCWRVALTGSWDKDDLKVIQGLIPTDTTNDYLKVFLSL